jgi:hypothetical protein
MSDLDSHLSLSHLQVSSDSDYLLELELFHDESLSTEPESLNPADRKGFLNCKKASVGGVPVRGVDSLVYYESY